MNMLCPIQGCPAGAYVFVYGLCATTLGGMAYLLWPRQLHRFFSFSWWYVPTIDARQAQMLREVRDIVRSKLILGPSHAQREIDRMVRIFSPRQVVGDRSFAMHGRTYAIMDGHAVFGMVPR